MRVQKSSRAALAGVLAVVTIGGLVACTPGADSSDSPTTLKYQFFTTAAQGLPDAPRVADALNDYAKDKGDRFRVELDPMDYDTFTTRMPLDIAAGQAGDVMFASSWLNDYIVNASKGNFLALDDLLPNYAPKLWKSLPESVWDAARVDGKIYGVPNQQLWPLTYGYTAREDVADKYGLDQDAISWYDDLDPFLADLKAGEPGKTVLYSDNTGAGTPWAGYYAENFDAFGATYGVGVRIEDEKLKVINIFDTDEFREASEMARKWYEAGYYATNPQSSTDALAAWNNGQTLVQLNQVSGTNLPAFPVVGEPLVTPRLTTAGILGTMSVVNADTRDPEAAVAFIERLNTDKDFYRLMTFGIEGEHYTVVDPDSGLVGFPEGLTAENSPYYLNLDWMVGDQFNAYYRDASQADSQLWEQQAKLNSSAKPSVALGFTPDTKAVENEVTNVAAAVTEFRDRNVLGLVDPAEGIPQLLDRMNSAGVDKIISELQKQIDDWSSSK